MAAGFLECFPENSWILNFPIALRPFPEQFLVLRNGLTYGNCGFHEAQENSESLILG